MLRKARETKLRLIQEANRKLDEQNVGRTMKKLIDFSNDVKFKRGMDVPEDLGVVNIITTKHDEMISEINSVIKDKTGGKIDISNSLKKKVHEHESQLVNSIIKSIIHKLPDLY